jgi:cation transport ATPase
MQQLNDEQVIIILNRIKADGVTDNNLQNALLDHYCCFIEEILVTSGDFELAYNIAFQAITPNGMHEIQEEFHFILNYNQQTIMKRIIYLSSFLTVFCISTAVMFKAVHWPGAAILIQTAFILVIINAVTLFSNSIKHWRSHTAGYNLRAVTGFIAALLISVGAIFKSFHYPTGGIQIVTGILLLNLIFLPMFFYHCTRGQY